MDDRSTMKMMDGKKTKATGQERGRMKTNGLMLTQKMKRTKLP